MRLLPALLVAACAAGNGEVAEPRAAVAPALLPAPAPLPVAPRIAGWLRGRDVARLTRDWPRCAELPGGLSRYEWAPVAEDFACDGWRYDVVVDPARPELFRVRATGTIAGVWEYRGPAVWTGE